MCKFPFPFVPSNATQPIGYRLQLLFDGGTVEAYLEKVNTFLKANPNEVLTLIFTNPEGASLSGLWDPAFQQSGVASFAYVPPSIPVKQSDVSIFSLP